MPRFRVELERRLFGPGERQDRNPFLGGMPPLEKRVEMSVRKWEFYAKDEDEVRKLMAEAQEQDIGNVRGYRLRSITQLPPGAREKQ